MTDPYTHAYPVDAQQDSISFTVAAHAGPVSVAYRQPSQGPRAQRVTRGCPPVATCTGTPGPLPCGCQERALDNRGSTGRIQADVRETYPRPQRGDRNNRTSSNPLTRAARTLNSWHSLAQLSSWCVNRIGMLIRLEVPAQKSAPDADWRRCWPPRQMKTPGTVAR
jgi:hypothetical protein